MSMNYSTAMNYNFQDYSVKKKSPLKQGLKGATVGAVALGAASLGFQKYILSDKSNKFTYKVAEKAAKEFFSGKKGFWNKTLNEILEISVHGKLNWAKAGKAGLIGGGIVGGIVALTTLFKNKNTEKQVPANNFGYYA